MFLLTLFIFFSSSSSENGMAAAAAVSAAAPAVAAKAAPLCIWLHGLGDSSAGWSFLKGEFSSRLPALKWQFPNSPFQPVTLAGGEAMASWMDLDALPVTAHTPEDRAGFESSTKILHGLIDGAVAAGTPASSIFLGGFSQGQQVFFFCWECHFFFPNSLKNLQ